MANRYLDNAHEELPNYEKRRRPERCSQCGPVRRATVRARGRVLSTAAARNGESPAGGFHRRIIKKPFYGLG